MKKKVFLPIVLSAFLIGFSCSTKLDLETEKTNVTNVIQKLLESYQVEDMELHASVMAQDEDMVSFGTDIAEHHVGWEAWKESHLAQWAAIDKTEITSTDLVVFLAETGNVAWFSDITNWSFVIQSDTMTINNARLTGVLEKRDDIWKIVQIHASIPQGEAFDY